MAYGTLPNIANAGHEPTPDEPAEQIARNLLKLPRQTRSKPARKAKPVGASSCTATNPPTCVVTAATAGHALGGAPSAAGAHGASKPGLRGVVSTDSPVYRDAPQAAAGAVTAVVGCGASEQF